MSLKIEYSDEPGLVVYALFIRSVDNKVYDMTSKTFETFSAQAQNDFYIVLEEDSDLGGFYHHEITDVSGIPATTEDNWYLLEIYKSIGSSFDRLSDPLLGSQVFYWDGTKEIPLGGASVTVDLSGVPSAVWNYQTRTLTQDVTCPDNSEEIAAIKKLIEEKSKELADLIEKQCQEQPTGTLPNAQTPRLGPLGSNGGASGIRFSR